MWVFIERVGDLYVGEAYEDNGQTILERTGPTTSRELAERVVPPGADAYVFDNALYDADQCVNDPRIPRWREFFLLRVRAGAGTASDADAAWVISELRSSNSIHATTALLSTLGAMGAPYEGIVVDFLNHPNGGHEAECAMSALIRMGLADKYANKLVEWMKGNAPPVARSGGSIVYGLASRVVRDSGNLMVLRTIVAAAKDDDERWETREHALRCLSHAIDIENAPIGERWPLGHPYWRQLLAQAEAMLREAEAN